MKRQKELVSERAKKQFFRFILIVALCNEASFAQTTKPDQKNIWEHLYLKLQMPALFHSQEDNFNYWNTDYELENGSSIVGINSEISYVLWDFLGVGIGSGFERLNPPHINYVPLYLTTTLFVGSEFFFDIKYGTHLGNVTRNGDLFRLGAGYNLWMTEKTAIFFSFTYSAQNIFKEFENSERPFHKYIFEGIGLTIGLHFN